jgi:hypothetical protein
MTVEVTGENQNQNTPAVDANTPPASAPATPPAAPVIDPKLSTDPTPPATPQTPSGPEAVTYETTGDAGLDVALSFVGNLGIGPEHPAMVATAKGDFSLIEAHLATLGDKATGYQQMVQLAKDAYGRSEATKAATAQKVSAAVLAVAGGQEQWDAVKAWAGKEASPEEKTALNAMFDAGPVQARAAAMLLTTMYRDASGTTVNPKKAVGQGSAGTQVPSDGPLNPREYHAAVQQLRTTLGSRMDASPEYAALRARLRR